jgi:TetR/AcrR family transcriptional regulator, transcriptional repressor for nem operon
VTNSQSGVAARPGKRERLIAAARSTLYEQGVERTTIADIAHAADVPVGNVYYYFKTKGDLVAEVIDQYQDAYATTIASLDQLDTPKARLLGLVAVWINQRENLTLHGCPVGTLCTELGKTADDRRPDAAAVLARLLAWIERQFHDMGRQDAHELAVTLLAAYEGIAVLANAWGDPELIATEGHRLDKWIDSL